MSECGGNSISDGSLEHLINFRAIADSALVRCVVVEENRSMIENFLEGEKCDLNLENFMTALKRYLEESAKRYFLSIEQCNIATESVNDLSLNTNSNANVKRKLRKTKQQLRCGSQSDSASVQHYLGKQLCSIIEPSRPGMSEPLRKAMQMARALAAELLAADSSSDEQEEKDEEKAEEQEEAEEEEEVDSGIEDSEEPETTSNRSPINSGSPELGVNRGSKQVEEDVTDRLCKDAGNAVERRKPLHAYEDDGDPVKALNDQPDEPWALEDECGELMSRKIPTASEVAELRKRGLIVDDYGRPIKVDQVEQKERQKSISPLKPLIKKERMYMPSKRGEVIVSNDIMKQVLANDIEPLPEFPPFPENDPEKQSRSKCDSTFDVYASWGIYPLTKEQEDWISKHGPIIANYLMTRLKNSVWILNDDNKQNN